jgi:putative polysaccharide biosynthesis protein
MKFARKNAQAPLFLAIGAVPAIALAVVQSPISLWVLDSLTGLLALAAASVAGMRLALGAARGPVCRLWQAALGLSVFIALAEFGGPWTEDLERRMGIEAASDWIVPCAALVTLWLAIRLDRIPVWPRRALWTGFALHFLATVFDALEGLFSLSSTTIDSVVDLAQFLALQFYLIGSITFVASLRWHHFTLQQSPMMLGDIARSMFSSQSLLHKYRYPRVWAINLPGAKTVLSLARFVICSFDCAPVVRKRFGIDFWTQFKGICAAAFQHGLDARAYYLFELYRPESMRRAGAYLTRYETKNGLFKILTCQLPKHEHRTPLGNKLAVHEFCERQGIPHAPLLGVAKNGKVELRCAGEGLDRDLFIKVAHSKGARGAERFKRVAANRYLDKKGAELSLAEVLDRLAERSRAGALLIEPFASNHPAIADLAEQSLIAIRVITCLNGANIPVVTHGMLRVLPKLEPNWPHDVELGSAVNLATGTLGLMTGDKDNLRFEWHENHPITGAPVLGRVLPQWPEIQSVALTAHEACVDRLLVGWDIALTPDGPILLEGNAYADVDFLQRVHRCPWGASPIGPLLFDRLIDLQHRIDNGTILGTRDYARDY